MIPQTQKQGRTLFETHPDHRVTHEYRALAQEVEERLKMPQAAAEVIHG